MSRFLAGALFLLATSACRLAPEGARPPPNIIFFLTDDQRWDQMGCAGHPILKTPTMDRLARLGVRFENMFVTTSICPASRASILTGSVERTHRFTFGTPPIARTFTDASYPTLLKRAGYRTGFIGKFGVRVESGAREAMFDTFKPLARNPYFKLQPDGSRRHITEIAGDLAVEFLREQDEAVPFCLSISFNAPHAEDGDKANHYPWPKAVDGMYEDVTIPPPALSSPEIFARHPDFLKRSMNRDRWFWRWDTPEKYRKNTRAYYRMVSGVDRVMARVLDALEEQGRAEDTIVIFSGDNGYYLGQRGFAGKWSHYGESLRVPLIVYDPRLNPSRRGKTLDPIALNIDIPATILALAGVEVPASYQGRSLVPLIRAETADPWRTDFFCEHLMNHASIPKWEGVRSERWAYARYFEQETGGEFLHDLAADAAELTNLADSPDHADVLKRMRRRCDALRDAYGGP